MIDVNDAVSLEDWAELAGYSKSVDDKGSRVCWWNSGGEERYYVQLDDSREGWVRVTNASRSGPEEFVFEAADSEIAARYFWGFFGTTMRSRSALPRLRVPVRADNAAEGYAVQQTTERSSQLVDPSGRVIMTARGDVSDIALLVKTSHWLRASIPEIVQTYTSPDGLPLFPA
ncbi:Imm61 family immunity protein [Mycolicibacterium sp. J2]|jgi:hypothetical protein|uniref:Imm61 family immunity protein n=1 Tax=Mycolicibacterium sp. J2 TaxID=2993511 RepID=UPI00224B2211|nr:Imm61 family immunity protein [Mycolicibacterium sp. J2]MCX2712228.1 Imm61 family immunity protein [Mycolicibacterium sp. J2]